MKLQLKSGRYYYLQKYPDRRGYRWIGLSLDPEELARQRAAFESGADVSEVLGDQAPGAWIAAHVELMLKRVRERAKAAGIYCDLTREDIQDMGNAQRWRCALSGIRFSLDRTENARARAFAPSIDRIHKDGGYTKINCRVVCVAMNLALNEFGELVFRKLAMAYCRRNRLLQPRQSFEDRQSLDTGFQTAEKATLEQ